MRERGSVFDFTDDQVLEAVEAAAAAGSDRAERILQRMLDRKVSTGEISGIDRIMAQSYLFGDRHGGVFRVGERNGDSGSERGVSAGNRRPRPGAGLEESA